MSVAPSPKSMPDQENGAEIAPVFTQKVARGQPALRINRPLFPVVGTDGKIFPSA